MSTILIPTTQNVELEYPIASLGDRILATLVDLSVQLGYLLAAFWLIKQAGVKPDASLSILLVLPATFYHLLCEVYYEGQSIGKRALRTRVIRLDGSSPTLSDYLLRWVLRAIDFFPAFYGVIGMVTVVLNKRGQRLGDIAAGTTVVKLKLVTHFADTIFVDTEEDYRVQFPEIKNLSDRDVSILKEVLDAGLRSNNPALLHKLSNKVKEVTGVQTQMPDKQFLDTVLKDYNFIFGRKRKTSDFSS